MDIRGFFTGGKKKKKKAKTIVLGRRDLLKKV